MSDSSDTAVDSQDGSGVVTVPRSQIKVLEKQAKERAEAVARAEKAERQLAFAAAGIPLNDKRFSYFIKGYDGEFEPDAIREAAAEVGLLETQEQPSQEQQAEQQTHQRIDQATRGQAVDEVDVDAAMASAFESGGSEQLQQWLAARGVPLADD